MGRCVVSEAEGTKQSKNSLGLGRGTLAWQYGLSPCLLEEVAKIDQVV